MSDTQFVRAAAYAGTFHVDILDVLNSTPDDFRIRMAALDTWGELMANRGQPPPKADE